MVVAPVKHACRATRDLAIVRPVSIDTLKDLTAQIVAKENELSSMFDSGRPMPKVSRREEPQKTRARRCKLTR